MIEVSRSPVSIHISLHRLDSQQSHSTHKTKFCQQCLRRGLDFCSTNGKRNRKDVNANCLKMASMVQEMGSWLRAQPLKSPGANLIRGTTKMKVSKVVVTRPEYGLVCQGNDDNISNSKREEEISSVSSEKMLPPWGNLDVQEETNISIPKREEEIRSVSSEKMLPPWGSLDVQAESSFESEGVSGPSNSGRINGVMLEPRLHFLEERDEDVLSKRILGLSRLNKFRSAFDLYMSMEVSGLQPNLHACNSLLSCLLRNGLLNNALEVFEIMKKKEKTTGHTYSLILKAIADTDGYDSALKMFMALEGESTKRNDFDAIVYNTMISICGKANNWVQTEKLWKTMKENGYETTTVTYSLLVSTFTRCGQPELAFDSYSEMVQNKLKPSEDMMQAIISACTKEGKWALALDVFENMLHSGLNPNIISYNSLINSLGKAGEVNLAFGVFKLMQSSGHKPDVYTWNALLSALYRGDRYADALQLFESIKREQKSQLNPHLYNTALMSCKRLGQWDRSLQLIWQMEASGLPVSTESYNLVIDACEVGREPKVALQVYEHMVHKNCTPNTFTYLSLIRACIWGSLWPEVEKILDHVTPDVSLYNAAIHGMCLQGKITVAKKLYMKMRDRGLKPDGKTRAMMLQNLKRDSDRTINRRTVGGHRWSKTVADFEGFFPP